MRKWAGWECPLPRLFIHCFWLSWPARGVVIYLRGEAFGVERARPACSNRDGSQYAADPVLPPLGGPEAPAGRERRRSGHGPDMPFRPHLLLLLQHNSSCGLVGRRNRGLGADVAHAPDRPAPQNMEASLEYI